MARSRSLSSIVALACGLSLLLVARPAGADTPPNPGTPSHDSCIVQATHLDFLGRAATPAEIADWQARFAAGTHRSRLPDALANSDEWLSHVVTGIYEHALGRSPEPDGLAYWVGELRGGSKVNRIASQVFGSGEFYNRVGNTPDSYVRGLYDLILDRPADSSGVTYWAGEVARIGRSRVAASFYDSLESRNRRVEDLYQSLLGRSAEPSGLTYWSTQLWTVNDVRLAVQLGSSQEYRNRAQRSDDCEGRLGFTLGALPPATIGQAYSANVVASFGGTAPRTFSAANLPAGLSMSAAGLISGTATAAVTPGDRTVSITVADADGASVIQTGVLTVQQAHIGVVADIDAALYSVCAATQAGEVWCWGNNDSKILGTTGSSSNVPVKVPGLSNIVQISLGGGFACALDGGGGVWCWGNNAHGQLGRGGSSTASSEVPTQVSLGSKATSVATGRYHTCAVLLNETARCWGMNINGQLGTGSTSATGLSTPQTVAGLSGVKSMAGGYFHTCATVAGGTVSCWGLNDYGQLGRPVSAARLNPSTVPDLTQVATLDISHHSTTCVVRTNGDLLCFGRNNDGQVGDTNLPEAVPTPTRVLRESVGVAVGQHGACGVNASGLTHCWGRQHLLGGGASGDTPLAANEVDGPRFVKTTLAERSVCGLTGQGRVLCWGKNVGGSLGHGSSADRFRPTPVSGF